MFWDATQRARRSSSTTSARGTPEPSTRHLQPWGVVRHAGRWYVVGLDTDRGEERVFRLSRVVGDARRVGAPASYDIPDGVDLRETTRRLAPPPPAVEATLLVRKGAGATLRRGAASGRGRTSPAPTPRARGTGSCSRRDRLAEEVLGLGPDVFVE